MCLYHGPLVAVQMITALCQKKVVDVVTCCKTSLWVDGWTYKTSDGSYQQSTLVPFNHDQNLFLTLIK